MLRVYFYYIQILSTYYFYGYLENLSICWGKEGQLFCWMACIRDYGTWDLGFSGHGRTS